jgi:hypothetical protein
MTNARGIVRPGKGNWIETRAALPHLLGFVAVAGISLLFQVLISPATKGLEAPIDPKFWSTADHERFAVSIHLWIALATAACVSVLFLITYALKVIWHEAGCRWLLVFLVIIGIFASLCFIADAGTSSSYLSFHEINLVRFPIANLTKPLNSLVGAAVASLFMAGAAVSIRVAVDRTRDAGEQAAERLKALILVGSVTTVLGTLSIGALHRLPGAATTGALIDVRSRDATWMRVEALLNSTPAAEQTHPALPIVARWIVARNQVPESEANAMATLALPEARSSDDFKSWALAPRDDAARTLQSRALDSVATAIASWWGLVFATSLVVVYVLGVVSIAPVSELRGAKALSLAAEGEAAGRWTVLLRVLTALAPLLTAGLAEAVRKVLELFPPSAA